MTNQEAAVKGLLGIRAQGYKLSVDWKGDCMYRGPNGLKCYVGHLIADEHYTERMEGCYVTTLVRAGYAELQDLDTILLRNLQGAHDRTLRLSGADEFEKRVREIFSAFSLEYPEP